jgi:membrane protein implicated in regulation of membrane protease activity
MVFFDIIATYSPFSRGTSFIISLGLSVIIANFGFVGAIVEWISDFIAGGGALKLIAFLLAVLIIYILIKTITEAEKKRRRKEEVKESEERVMKISKVFGEGEK